MLKRRAFLRKAVVALVSVVGGKNCLLAHAQTVSETVVMPSLQRVHLRFVFAFLNPLPERLEGQFFWCYLPISTASNQRVVSQNISMPHQLVNDALGHTILKLSFDSFPPYGQKLVTVSCELAVTKQHEAIAQPMGWLHAEQYLEVDDERIQALALSLRAATSMATVKSIYDWVRTNLAYAGYLADDYGAAYALERRTGDCTEYAYLVVALARACQLPARMVGGYVVAQGGMTPKASDYHNWAEVYADDRWHLVDAQKENYLSSVDAYVAFRYYNSRHTNVLAHAHRFKVDGQLVVRQ